METNSVISHTCDELLVWKWEIWISFQGDWGLLQGDYVSASKMRDFAWFHATPSLARLYESTGRAIAVTPASVSASALASALASASALLKMLKFL